jgi:hypothetical protein
MTEAEVVGESQVPEEIGRLCTCRGIDLDDLRNPRMPSDHLRAFSDGPRQSDITDLPIAPHPLQSAQKRIRLTNQERVRVVKEQYVNMIDRKRPERAVEATDCADGAEVPDGTEDETVALAEPSLGCVRGELGVHQPWCTSEPGIGPNAELCRDR